MFIFYLFIFSIIGLSTSIADSFIYSNNSSSVGKIIIDGKELIGTNSFLKGSGIHSKISRNIENFSSIHSQGSFDIEYKQGAPSLLISGDDNIIKHIITQVDKGILTISVKKSYQSENAIIISLSSPTIKSLIIDGSSNVKLSQLQLPQLAIDLLGSVDLMASGQVSTLHLAIHGASDVDTKLLIADIVTVNIQGSADVILTAKQTLNAKILGSGDIVFFGEPNKINKNIMGSGDIEAGD